MNSAKTITKDTISNYHGHNQWQQPWTQWTITIMEQSAITTMDTIKDNINHEKKTQKPSNTNKQFCLMLPPQWEGTHLSPGDHHCWTWVWVPVAVAVLAWGQLPQQQQVQHWPSLLMTLCWALTAGQKGGPVHTQAKALPAKIKVCNSNNRLYTRGTHCVLQPTRTNDVTTLPFTLHQRPNSSYLPHKIFLDFILILHNHFHSMQQNVQ